MSRAAKEVTKDGISVDVTVEYSKGETSYLSGNYDKRGYYLYVYPFELTSGGCRSFVLFEGRKMLLLEVKRQSPKGFAQAVKLAKERENELIDVVIAEKFLKNLKAEQQKRERENAHKKSEEVV